MRLLLGLALLLAVPVIGCGEGEDEELAVRSCLWTGEDLRVCVRYDQLTTEKLANVLRTCVSTRELVATLVESCPTEGRIGACARDIGSLHGTIVRYEGSGDTADVIQRGCQEAGGTFEP